MRAIDADALIDDCKKYLNSLNPSRDGKECTRMHWLIGILSNAPTIEPESNCFGCKHVGMWENEIEYGYPSPCTICKRRAKDNYER